MITCKFCSKETDTIHHQVRCPKNPDRKGVGQWTDERRATTSVTSKETNAKCWTDEKRLVHSAKMKQVVADKPDSYSKNNVSGRVKMYSVPSALGDTNVKGTWELSVATWLNEQGIRWTNEIKPYSYFWNDAWHLYFPDFLLLDYNILIEVKGYETDRDRAKWAVVADKKFLVIKEAEMKMLGAVIEQTIAASDSQTLVS